MNNKDFPWTLDEGPFVCKAFAIVPREDGTYDVVVVDAVGGPLADDVHLELARTFGPRKGEVVLLRGTKLDREPLLALGLPGTLSVRAGAPSLAFD